MMAAMGHRGPDDEGFLAAAPATLGMRRLSIIDLAGGAQPIFNEDRTRAAIVNGEIYNFRELRSSLEARGHRFRSRSDAETTVHAYEEWGEESVERLRGMFALAVLECEGSRGQRLFLARDRLGIKPLYYWLGDGLFLFASEVRALLATGLVARRLSRTALESYLMFGSVAEPMTLVEGIYSLEPGHRLELRLDAGRPSIEPKSYWNLAGATNRPADSPPGRFSAAASEARRRLEQAVREHLAADVPLGIFLSSGIDSAALAALASREQSVVHTFTVIFPEQDFSEARLARETAKRFGTRHEELLLAGEEMLERQEEAVSALDQPSMDGINTYFVARAARQAGLKVALSGLGGDEVFGGYTTFRATPLLAALAGLARRSPEAVRSLAAAALLCLGKASRRTDALRKLAAAWRAPDSLPHPYFFARVLFTPEQVRKLVRDGTLGSDGPWRDRLNRAARAAGQRDSFTAVTQLELESYLVNTLLRDTDAMSMAHSLEVRVPFLDHRLVEFVARLPRPLKQRRGAEKALLRAALGELLPREVAGQRKRTFTLPWEKWLRAPLREPVEAGLAHLAPTLAAALAPAAVQAVWQDFLNGRTTWSRPWSLYVLNRWVSRHLDGPGASATHPGRPSSAGAAQIRQESRT
jgi:asparagine synthase (glutamine-hydrolysing)